MGQNNKLLDYPRNLEWLPNIRREDFRNYGYLGVRGRGEIGPTVQEMPKFGHLVNLSAYAYDRGSKIVGMIEERLGEAAFLDFMRGIYQKYQYRILRVADFQRELEAYTGRSWEEFFQHWLYGTGMSDWSVQNVDDRSRPLRPRLAAASVHAQRHAPGGQGRRHPQAARRHQRADRPGLPPGRRHRLPGAHPDHARRASPGAGGIRRQGGMLGLAAEGEQRSATVRVEIMLPSEPTQISVDPDHVLLDSNPTNNHWKPEVRWRLTPLYTQLEETDVTNAYDRWNVIVGPWVYGAAYNDPWYTRSPLAGFKATGLSHAGTRWPGRSWPIAPTTATSSPAWMRCGTTCRLPNTQIGITVEKSLFTLGTDTPVQPGGGLWPVYPASQQLAVLAAVRVRRDFRRRPKPLPARSATIRCREPILSMSAPAWASIITRTT